MVRFLKSDDLEERRRELVARSEIHRRMMQLEVANLRYSAALWKQRFSFLRTVRKLWRFAAPLAGGFLARKQAASPGSGSSFVSSLLSGLRLAGELMPLFKKSAPPAAKEPSPADHA